ncbi:MAG: NAD(P)-dependent oxidoreductase [Ramlibacter sp.]|nr:NAD(P)-dependent oxidoreductase [Ramlibacter sp.]
MRVGIIGATGVIGRRLVPLLASDDHSVVSIVRPGREDPACESRQADILDFPSLEVAFAGLDAVINLATSIPNGRGGGDWAQNDRIRIKGTENVLRAIRSIGGSCRWVQQSVAMLHQGKSLADEDCEVTGQGVLTSAILMEAMVQGSGLDWALVRGGALYGPDTTRDVAFFQRIARGELRRPVEAADRWISFVHADDLAGAFRCALNAGGGRAYIAADDVPTTYARLFSAFEQAPSVAEGSILHPLPSFRVSNARLRGCGWIPRVSSIYEWEATRPRACQYADAASA